MQRVIERILNLLAFLLTSTGPVTADEIRHTVAGYDQESDAAFRRTFERDKDLLRSLGVPLTMTAMDIWEVEDGYVVPSDEYAIDDPHLTEEERSALLAAAQAVQFSGQTAGLSAIFKLGGASPALNAPNVAADLGHDLAQLAVLFDAVSTHTKISFTYRDKSRTVMPYALAHRLGHWYLAAPEASEVGTVKAFRVDRMSDPLLEEERSTYTVPEGFNASDVIPQAPENLDSDRSATVRFDADLAGIVADHAPNAKEVQRDGESVIFELPLAYDTSFVGWVLGFDDRAEILGPANLRKRLIDHIQASA
jgi:predicted DNA-binding transcriptional regulator YafY